MNALESPHQVGRRAPRAFSEGRLTAVEARVFALAASFGCVLFAAGLSYLFFAEMLHASNVRDPLNSNGFDYLVGVAGALVMAIVLLFAPLPITHRTALLFLWAAKTATMLGLMLVYEAQYETLDAYSYHELARDSSVEFGDLRWGGSTDLVTWLVQLAYTVIPSSYHLTKVLFSFAGLLGIYLTWRAVSILIGETRLNLLYVIGLFPSLLFWSSIIGKDPLLVFLVGLFVLGVARLQQDRYRSGLTLALAAVALACLVRPWMGAILALPLLAVLLARQIGEIKASGTAFAARSAVLAAMLAFAAFLMLGGDLSATLQSLDDLVRLWEVGGSAQSAPVLGSVTDLVKFAPVGAFTALFRPLPGDVGGAFGMAAGVENAALLFAFVLCIAKFRKHLLQRSSFLVLTGVLSAWALLYALLSYQNLGAASRFKAQILPVMLALMFMVWYGTPNENRRGLRRQ